MAGENINRRLNIYINDKEVVNSMRGVTAAMNQVRNQIRNLDASAEDYDEQLKKLKNTYAQLQSQQDAFKRSMAETPGILGRIKNALGPVATGFLAAFSITAVVSKANQVIQEGWQKIVDFNQKQADLASIMGKSRTQVAGLTLDAMKYGATTSFTASQVSVLQTELARLGKTEVEIKKMTRGVLDAAVALEAELGEAAELVGGQLNAFGEDAAKSGEYADVMANSVNISATSFESLSTALPKVSKVAKQEGVTFQKLNSILGVLADENIRAETAGTGFRNILLESAKAGKPWEEMLEKIRKSTNQSKVAMELFGKENAIVAVTLANQTEKIERNTKALENSAGAAQQLAGTKLDSLKGSMTIFGSAWEGLILSIEKGDGFIAKAVRGIVDLGTSILGLITPTQKQTELIVKQQAETNVLARSVISLNKGNKYRKELLVELQQKYPNFLKNLDIEKVTNTEIASRLREVNKQYREKIRLTAIDEELQDNMSKSVKAQRQILNDTKALNEMASKFDLRSADGSLSGIVDSATRNSELGIIPKGVEAGVIKIWNRIQENQRLINEMNKQATELQNLGKSDVALDLLDGDPAPDKVDGEPTEDEISDEEKKKRQKALEDAKKHSEDLLKAKEKSDADLLALQRSNQDISLGLMKESFEKEREVLNAEYDRKIQDVQLKVTQYQTEIDKLNASLSDPKNSKADVEVIKQTIALKMAAQKEYSEQLILLEQTRDLKIAGLRQKYFQKEFEALNKANQDQLAALQTRQNNELASIVSLEDAKELLQGSLSEKELSKIRTLDQAKKALKQKQLKEEYDLQEKHLLDLAARAQAILVQEEIQGFDLISDEEREEILKFLDDVALKLSELGVKKNEESESDQSESKSLSGIDILGFGADQWNETFNNLDTLESKIQAVSMVVGALGQAFSMFFSFFDAADQRSLQKFTRSQDRKKKDLADQLEKGYITQEVYNARMEKLEQEREKKQAELEYKKAVRERITAAFGIVSNTGIGIAKSVAASPLTGGMPWAGIVAGIGALQLAGLLAQPLPPKSGYRDGGFTPFGDPNEEAGVVHKSEYVIPQKVLFSSDPAIPAIMSYLEAKRTGKGFKEGGFSDDNTPMVLPAPDVGGSQATPEMLATLNRLSSVLERMEEKEWMAFLVNDLKAAKLIRDKIRELEKIENQARK